MTEPRQRDPYADVGAATRVAVERAMPGLTLPEARVLLALVARLTTWSRSADRFALGQLAAATGMDARAIRRAIRGLEARGAIAYTPGASPPGGRRESSRFALPDPGPGVTGTGGQVDRGSVGPHTGGRGDPRNRGSVRPPSREVRENSPEDSYTRASRGLTKADANGDSAFAAFWAAWPRKVAKPAARKAWKAAVRKAPAARILEGAQRHAAGHAAAGTELRFIPHPARWLNEERWDNDPPAVSTNGTAGRSGDWTGGKSAEQLAAEATERIRRTMGLDGGPR